MRALVTGAGGFIGGHLVETLAERDHVTAISRAVADLSTVSGDALAARIAGHDLVFHLAGVTRALNLASYRRSNVEGTRRVLEACVAAGCRRVVLASSLAAVGPSRGGPLTEDSPANPVSWYGQSKLEAEAVAREYAGRVEIVILRPAIVYGPRDRYSLLYLWLLAHHMRPLAWTDPSLSLVHVSDCVDAFIRAATSGHGVYHVAAPEAISLSSLARRLSSILGRSAVEIAYPDIALLAFATVAELGARIWRRRAGFTRDKVRELLAGSWVTSAARSERELGWRATVPLDDGLRETIAWYRAARWL